MTIATAISLVNGVALVIFLVLLGATVFSMLLRVRDYRRARAPLPVILKRGLVLFGALSIIGAEATALRVLGVTLPEGSIERLTFTVQYDVILLGALAYYAKTELFDVDDPSKP